LKHLKNTASVDGTNCDINQSSFYASDTDGLLQGARDLDNAQVAGILSTQQNYSPLIVFKAVRGLPLLV
jgi:hypothetical protein